MIAHFNSLVNMFSTFALTGVTAEQRAVRLCFLIDVLEAANDLRNFHLAFAVLGAFGSWLPS